MTNYMFEQPTHGVKDTCEVCCWFKSEMCPHNAAFVGRPMFDTSKPPAYQICHRFTLTHRERERRWQQVLDKMHENIDPNPEVNWPF